MKLAALDSNQSFNFLPSRAPASCYKAGSLSLEPTEMTAIAEAPLSLKADCWPRGEYGYGIETWEIIAVPNESKHKYIKNFKGSQSPQSLGKFI